MKKFNILTFIFLITLALSSCHPSKKKTETPLPAPQDIVENEPITTPQPVKRNVTLKWDAPLERENGDRLYAYEIGGYEIVWQKEGDTQWNSIVLFDDQSYMLEEHVIPDLETGTYIFAIACFDIDGLYSKFSDPIIKLITNT